ncbi:MAG: hypothetical protein ACXWJS_08575, partial [Hyphomicrobium sp.]
WCETGTEHTPGIQPADVRELLDHGATTIVLLQGMLKRLEICPETSDLLKRQGVAVCVLPTQDAVDLYNDLRKTERVAGLVHSGSSGQAVSFEMLVGSNEVGADEAPAGGGSLAMYSVSLAFSLAKSSFSGSSFSESFSSVINCSK